MLKFKKPSIYLAVLMLNTSLSFSQENTPEISTANVYRASATKINDLIAYSHVFENIFK